MGQQRVEQGQIISMDTFIPLCNGSVKLPALIERHQVVGRFLHDSMFENVPQIRRRRLHLSDIELGEKSEMLMKVFSLAVQGVNIVQDTIPKDTPDHTGNLEGKLLAHAQTVDAAGDHPLDSIRQGRQIASFRRRDTLPILNNQQPRIAQGVGDFLAEERMTLCLLLDGPGH